MLKDYPKCNMSQDPTATAARRMLAVRLRPYDWRARGDDLNRIFDEIRECIEFSRYIGAIDSLCETILWQHSFKVQQEVSKQE